MQKLLLVAAIVLVCSSMAFATPEYELIVGSNSTGWITGPVPTSYFGWTGITATGISNSPDAGFPGALDLGTFTATDSTSTQTLDVLFSDTGFTTPAGGFSLGYSVHTIIGTGPSSASGWWDNTDTLGAETNPIGTITFPTGVGTSTVTAGGTVVSPYSLTIEEAFSPTTAVAFSADGSIIATPEPTSIVLFGTILSLAGFAFRRKLKKNS